MPRSYQDRQRRTTPGRVRRAGEYESQDLTTVQFDSLVDLLADTDGESIQEVQMELTEEGVDLDKLKKWRERRIVFHAAFSGFIPSEGLVSSFRTAHDRPLVRDEESNVLIFDDPESYERPATDPEMQNWIQEKLAFALWSITSRCRDQGRSAFKLLSNDEFTPEGADFLAPRIGLKTEEKKSKEALRLLATELKSWVEDNSGSARQMGLTLDADSVVQHAAARVDVFQ